MADDEVPLDSDSHDRVDRAGQGYLGQGVEDGEDVRVDAELIQVWSLTQFYSVDFSQSRIM